jgi:hypothetical protein
MDTITLLKKAVPRARAVKDKSFALKVKNLQSFDVAKLLTKAGWTQTGRRDYDKGTEIGFNKGEHFVKICDWGAFPYYLGDTVFYPGVVITGIENRQTGASIR